MKRIMLAIFVAFALPGTAAHAMGTVPAGWITPSLQFPDAPDTTRKATRAGTGDE